MTTQWNWQTFFQYEVEPPFLIQPTNLESWRELLALSFQAGLTVIVTSVPPFAHQHWLTLRSFLATHCQHYPYVALWLEMGDLIRTELEEVRTWLQYNVEQALHCIEQGLAERSHMEQFAVIACLWYFAQTNTQARLILKCLLSEADPYAQQIQRVLRYFRSLTKRQQDVAMLAAQGMTNQEIAAALFIEANVVAEHLTTIFRKFQEDVDISTDGHGSRYRLIHWLTRLFTEHPDLLLGR